MRGVDRYGVPIAKITFKYRENEAKMMREMYDTAESILKAAKAEIVPFDRNFLGNAGQAIHEHSTGQAEMFCSRARRRKNNRRRRGR